MYPNNILNKFVYNLNLFNSLEPKRYKIYIFCFCFTF